MEESLSLVRLTDLKTIDHPKGNLYHGIKKSESTFAGFGEVYFSSVLRNEIKGWKKHTAMTLNLVVINGKIRFVVFNENQNANPKFQAYILSRDDRDAYKRLTIPAGYWVAFQGLADGENLLMNIASLEHVHSESINIDLSEIPYEW